jgi:light-harvesting complex I chlorophyll a/b binding protein 1
MEAGATAPFGYFDPLGLSKGKSVAEIKKWRESEVKHGRVAMLATLGVFIQEKFSPFYNPESGNTDPGPALGHFQEIEALVRYTHTHTHTHTHTESHTHV